MLIYIRPFKADDFSAFEPLERIYGEEYDDPKIAKMIEESGLSVTGVAGDVIVGCGGVHPIDENQGELWLRVNKNYAKLHPIELYKWLKAGIRIIEETYPFRQLNAVVKCGYEKGKKFIESFGYKQTQVIKYKNEEHYVYSKLVKDQ